MDMPPGLAAPLLIVLRDSSRSLPTVLQTATPRASFRQELLSASTPSTGLRLLLTRYLMVSPARLVFPVPPFPANAIVYANEPPKKIHERMKLWEDEQNLFTHQPVYS